MGAAEVDRAVRLTPAEAAPGAVRGGVLASGLLTGTTSSVRGVSVSRIVPLTVVPRPGEEASSSVPPTAPTRSRIPIRPSPSPRSEGSSPTPSSLTEKWTRCRSRPTFTTTRTSLPACLSAFWIASAKQK